MSSGIDTPVAILAGGLATRIRPLTETLPKILLDVAGKPFLDHQLESLREQGITRVVLCVGFLGELVRQRVPTMARLGLDIQLSFDGPTLLGTGGAIRQALPLLGDEFFVMYGDSYLRIDFNSVAERFHESARPGLMTVFRNHGRWETSNVDFRNGVIEAYDKKLPTGEMSHVDYGLSMFRASVFDRYSTVTPLDLSDVMRDLVINDEMAGYEAQHRFYEIGSFDGLRELGELLSSGTR
jgi:N-acetyl-alpha-D-muramate 1-phosphate uridylyltransferase